MSRRKRQTEDRPKNRLLPELAWGGGLVLLTLLVYIPAMDAGVIWDDNHLIFENPTIRSPGGLKDIWFSTKLPDYWPLTSTMFFLEWRIWKNDHSGYHIVNILLHGLCSVVMWRILRRLAIPGAWVAAAIFAVHPVAVASAAWISERKNTLSMLWCALAVLAYLRFDDKKHWGWYVAALVSFLLALLAKTSIVLVPLVILILCWWRRGQIRPLDLLMVLPLLLMSFGLGLLTLKTQAVGIAHLRPEGLASRIAATGLCTWFYFYKTLLPVGLSMIYPRWDVVATSVWSWLPLAGLVGAAGLCAWCWKTIWGGAVLLAIGCYIALLLPVLGLVQMKFHMYSLVADHLHYLALIVPIALVVAGLTKLFARYRNGDKAARALAAVVLVALSALSWQRAQAFVDNFALWTDTVAKNPAAWAAHSNLGESYRQRKNVDQAMVHFRKAVEIEPTAVKARNNLANLLGAQGEVTKAIEHFTLALEIAPEYAEAHYNLANIYRDQTRVKLALEHYQLALENNPRYAKAHHNMAITLMKIDRVDDAIDHYRRALRINPTYALAHYNLSNALKKQGLYQEANKHRSIAARLQRTGRGR